MSSHDICYNRHVMTLSIPLINLFDTYRSEYIFVLTLYRNNSNTMYLNVIVADITRKAVWTYCASLGTRTDLSGEGNRIGQRDLDLQVLSQGMYQVSNG